jgi:multisubunit Na+/H+ antiporter MnhC subunit
MVLFLYRAGYVRNQFAGPKINPKHFELDKAMFKLDPVHLTLIILHIVILMAIYARFLVNEDFTLRRRVSQSRKFNSVFVPLG